MSYRVKNIEFELTYTKLYYISKTTKDIGKTKLGQEKRTLHLLLFADTASKLQN